MNAFDYRQPDTPEEALTLLHDLGEDARVIAGGTALVIMLKQRLVMPEDFDPLDCLATSSTVGQCAVPVPNKPSDSDGFYAAAAAQTDSVVTVNLNEVFCTTAPVCLPMDGDSVVWRDDHHYTAEYVEAKREGVWQALEDAGALGRGCGGLWHAR